MIEVILIGFLALALLIAGWCATGWRAAEREAQEWRAQAVAGERHVEALGQSVHRERQINHHLTESIWAFVREHEQSILRAFEAARTPVPPPEPPPAVHIPAELDAKERLERRISEDTVDYATADLMAKYHEAGLSPDLEDVRKEARAFLLGEPLPASATRPPVGAIPTDVTEGSE